MISIKLSWIFFLLLSFGGLRLKFQIYCSTTWGDQFNYPKKDAQWSERAKNWNWELGVCLVFSIFGVFSIFFPK